MLENRFSLGTAGLCHGIFTSGIDYQHATLAGKGVWYLMRILFFFLLLPGLFVTPAVALDIYLAKVTQVDTEQHQVQVQLLNNDSSMLISVNMERQKKLFQNLQPDTLVRLWGNKTLDGFYVIKLMPASPPMSSNIRLLGVRSRMSGDFGGGENHGGSEGH
ncbi:MAG: hypothetical protein U9R69_11290, partial [Thermodesulfobacteriota bacterium]|nr:hypothetical protein [Thermodesulfobacteriota bacterium]